MKIIEPSVELITEKDPFKRIELAGRTCYKSENKITDDSARKFTRGLMKGGHTAMVEHATFCFEVGYIEYDYIRFHFESAQFIHCTRTVTEHPRYGYYYRYLVSGNLRALNEFGYGALLHELYSLDKDLVYVDFSDEDWLKEHYYSKVKLVDLSSYTNLTEEEILAHTYYTFRFITDRGVTHEMVRHRPASFAQESTRYCNYSREQFGRELTFIKPAMWDSYSVAQKTAIQMAFNTSENMYNALIREGTSPQCARAVLPNALKTEIVMTANKKEWEHFFDLRSRGKTGAPHPDIKVIADKALSMIE